MAWQIEFEAGALKDLKKFNQKVARRITSFLKTRIAVLDNPLSLGTAVIGSDLGEFWRYRAGDYRIVCEIRDKELVILATSIGHRREVYR